MNYNISSFHSSQQQLFQCVTNNSWPLITLREQIVKFSNINNLVETNLLSCWDSSFPSCGCAASSHNPLQMPFPALRKAQTQNLPLRPILQTPATTGQQEIGPGRQEIGPGRPQGSSSLLVPSQQHTELGWSWAWCGGWSVLLSILSYYRWVWW